MINIAICEDNAHDQQCLRTYIEEVVESKKGKGVIRNYNIYTYNKGEDMLTALEHRRYDIVFLDVYMKQLTGMELAKYLRELDQKTIIIFTTSSTDFAIEAYNVRAFHYLLKPLSKVALQEILRSAINHKLEREACYYLFPTGEGVAKVNLNSILYVECSGRKTLVVTEEKKIPCTYSINMMEEKLDELGFARCHRSFIVNMRYVKNFKHGIVLLENEEEILMSKYKQKEVKEKVADYLGGQI